MHAITNKHENAHNRTYTKSMRICGRNNDAFGTQKKKKRNETKRNCITIDFTHFH